MKCVLPLFIIAYGTIKSKIIITIAPITDGVHEPHEWAALQTSRFSSRKKRTKELVICIYVDFLFTVSALLKHQCCEVTGSKTASVRNNVFLFALKAPFL